MSVSNNSFVFFDRTRNDTITKDGSKQTKLGYKSFLAHEKEIKRNRVGSKSWKINEVCREISIALIPQFEWDAKDFPKLQAIAARLDKLPSKLRHSKKRSIGAVAYREMKHILSKYQHEYRTAAKNGKRVNINSQRLLSMKHIPWFSEILKLIRNKPGASALFYYLDATAGQMIIQDMFTKQSKEKENGTHS